MTSKVLLGHPAPLMLLPLLSCLALTLFTLYYLSLLHASKALLSLYWTTCIYFEPSILSLGLPRWLSSKESACSTGDESDVGSIPGLERSPGGRNGSPFQDSCLENLMDRGAKQGVHGVANSWTWLKRLSGSSIYYSLRSWMIGLITFLKHWYTHTHIHTHTHTHTQPQSHL